MINSFFVLQNETDLSSYKITPLREERQPLPSKTEEDYGIDDVNTDDSTDDEDCPKKVVPAWAKLVQGEGVYYLIHRFFTNHVVVSSYDRSA